MVTQHSPERNWRQGDRAIWHGIPVVVEHVGTSGDRAQVSGRRAVLRFHPEIGLEGELREQEEPFTVWVEPEELRPAPPKERREPSPAAQLAADVFRKPSERRLKGTLEVRGTECRTAPTGRPIKPSDADLWQQALIRGRESRRPVVPMRLGRLVPGEYQFSVQSDSQPWLWYQVVVVERNGLAIGSCGCDAGRWGTPCKHLALVIAKLDLWPFLIADQAALELGVA